jgi:hypothetical protein
MLSNLNIYVSGNHHHLFHIQRQGPCITRNRDGIRLSTLLEVEGTRIPSSLSLRCSEHLRVTDSSTQGSERAKPPANSNLFRPHSVTLAIKAVHQLP